MILPRTPRSGFSYFLKSGLGVSFKEAFYPSAKADGNCIVFSMPLFRHSPFTVRYPILDLNYFAYLQSDIENRISHDPATNPSIRFLFFPEIQARGLFCGSFLSVS